MARQFVLAHISDLHCSPGVANSNLTHSIPHLQGIEQQLKNVPFDRLIVSGDVAHRGDRDSLLFARTWLTSHWPLPGGGTIGLGINDPTRLAVIPGNHDAFNSGTSNSLWDLWQESLSNFNAVFTDQQMNNLGVRVDWLERDDAGVFLAYVDSCYLGGVSYDAFQPFDRIARGKLSARQSKALLGYYDDGVKGRLHRRDGTLIPAALFAESLKIVVMHHYIFRPTRKVAPRMHMFQARDVMHNLALADFDVLLCGHSHLADEYPTTYRDQFDPRARARYIMNLFRRAAGVESKPVQFETDGRRLSKKLSLFINVLYRWLRHHGRDSAHDAIIRDFVTVLRKISADPGHAESDIKRFLKENPGVEEEVSAAELDELLLSIQVHLTPEQLTELQPAAERLYELAKEIGKRRFVQVMNGSACKVAAPGRKRCFNVYTIDRLERGWQLQIDEYEWDASASAYTGVTAQRVHRFRNL